MLHVPRGQVREVPDQVDLADLGQRRRLRRRGARCGTSAPSGASPARRTPAAGGTAARGSDSSKIEFRRLRVVHDSWFSFVIQHMVRLTAGSAVPRNDGEDSERAVALLQISGRGVTRCRWPRITVVNRSNGAARSCTRRQQHRSDCSALFHAIAPSQNALACSVRCQEPASRHVPRRGSRAPRAILIAGCSRTACRLWAGSPAASRTPTVVVQKECAVVAGQANAELASRLTQLRRRTAAAVGEPDVIAAHSGRRPGNPSNPEPDRDRS